MFLARSLQPAAVNHDTARPPPHNAKTSSTPGALEAVKNQIHRISLEQLACLCHQPLCAVVREPTCAGDELCSNLYATVTDCILSPALDAFLTTSRYYQMHF